MVHSKGVVDWRAEQRYRTTVLNHRRTTC